jgi:dihydroorotate dehydrogenase
MYSILRSIFFKADPEQVHDLVLWCGRLLQIKPLHRLVLSILVQEDPRLAVRIAGLDFPNPVGLAAGFDKLGSGAPLFSALGFGFLELGTVTVKGQPGNPKPRIVRFAAEKALANSMGFPSKGVETQLPYLQAAKKLHGKRIIGVNIGKNKETTLENAADDYITLFKKLKNHADYIVVNVSSPNTPELRRLQEPDRLHSLFAALEEANDCKIPIFLKIAPDLTEAELEEIVKVIKNNKISGVVATNTTVSRAGLPQGSEKVPGGVSGQPLRLKALEVVRWLYQHLDGNTPIIGVGGIASGADAEAMIRAGANAVQIYTGLIYEGPLLVKRINKHLLDVIEREGYTSLLDMVGKGAT